ncbi:SDR family NAD(P)-dependent oxidoreductase [Streptomyces sp. NBC_01267]|uniref:SDR family NAD(P)-dependent oxidoreductase n=1 Tax=Streptomyces sp. NBC_01267 TaxID=2903805 RepID=UPI002E30BB66|nr:SDR family NAD(P)-dependent oxidoreductase [Streptomyces sp. NBC_01267]
MGQVGAHRGGTHQRDEADGGVRIALGGGDRRGSRITAEHGAPRVLVNNAGGNRDRPFLSVTTEDWDTVMATNLSAPSTSAVPSRPAPDAPSSWRSSESRFGCASSTCRRPPTAAWSSPAATAGSAARTCTSSKGTSTSPSRWSWVTKVWVW